MSQRHAIRLRGPWWGVASRDGDREVTATIEKNEARFKTTIPFVWSEQIPSDFTGTVGLLRKFNGSAGMSEADEVWLTISSLAVTAEIHFNGSLIGQYNPRERVEFAISKLLKPFNELLIMLKVSGESTIVLVGDVSIEIAQ